MKRTSLSLACLLALTGLSVLAPAGAADPTACVHPLVYHTVLCPNRAPNTPSPLCDNPVAVGARANCDVGGSDPDGDALAAEICYGDGSSCDQTGSFPSGGYSPSTQHTWWSAGSYCVQARTHDNYGGVSPWSGCWWETIVQPNRAPGNPGAPSGPSSVARNVLNSWTSTSTDPDGDDIQYDFCWYKGTSYCIYEDSMWEPSGTTARDYREFYYAWETGTWCLTVKVQDASHGWGPESACKYVTVG